MTKIELETCIETYGRDIYSFCRQLTKSTLEADELYQDTFLKAVELNASIRSDHNPKSFLLSVAIRIWKNKRRKFAWRNRIAARCLAGGRGQNGMSSGKKQSGTADFKTGRSRADPACRKPAAKPAENPRSALLYGRSFDSADCRHFKHTGRNRKKQAAPGKNDFKKRFGGNFR